MIAFQNFCSFHPEGFPGGTEVKKKKKKKPPANAGDAGDVGLVSGLERSPGGGKETHSSILACKFHEQKSLVGSSPRGHTEWYTAEHTHTHIPPGRGISE